MTHILTYKSIDIFYERIGGRHSYFFELFGKRYERRFNEQPDKNKIKKIIFRSIDKELIRQHIDKFFDYSNLFGNSDLDSLEQSIQKITNKV